METNESDMVSEKKDHTKIEINDDFLASFLKDDPKWKDELDRFPELGKEIGELVKTKQLAYGNSFGLSGDVMRALYPYGISPEQYDDALTIIRIVDKLFRIATDKDALGESPYKDIAGYGLLGAIYNSTKRKKPIIKGNME